MRGADRKPARLGVRLRLLGEQLDSFGQVVDDPPPFDLVRVSGVKSLAEEVSHLAGSATTSLVWAIFRILAYFRRLKV
jgi:hypothetical protein